MSELYFVKVEALIGARVDLRVTIIHPDAEEFLEDTTFAHLLVADSLLLLSEKKAAKAPLARVVSAAKGRANASVVSQVIKSVRVRDIANLPDDMAEMSDWNEKRWRKRDSLPSAVCEVTVTDASLLSHLTVGMEWDSTAFSSEHVVEEDPDAEDPEDEVPLPEEALEPLVLGKKSVFVITPRELYGADWAGIEKKKKLDPKWADTPFAFMAVEKLMTLFTKANPEPARSKADEKEVSKVQLALTDRLDNAVDDPLVTNMEFYATHATLDADAVRAFFASNGIEVLRLAPGAKR